LCGDHSGLSWVKPLSIGAAVLYLGVVILGWRTGRVEVRALAAGFVVFPVAIALSTLAAWGLWWLLKLPITEAERETIGEPVAAFLILAALAVFISIYALLWKWVRVYEVDLGALGWWTIQTLGSAWLLPGGSFVTFWQLVSRVALTGLASRVPSLAVAVVMMDLGTLPAITIVGAGAYAMFASLNPSTIAVAAALFVPGAMLPQVSRVFHLKLSSTPAT
jgi:hypothetical protein